MVTNPVERIRTYSHETPLALDLPALLTRLAALPPSPEAPYLTVSLDWRPEGTEPGRLPAPEPKRSERVSQSERSGTQRRPSWQQVSRQLDELVTAHGPRGVAFDSLSADVERIRAFIDGELDPAAQGVIFVACAHHDVFEPVPLDVPVETAIITGPIPSLRQLVSVAEDVPPYAVLVADQRDAFLWLFERQTWERGVELEADDYPRKQQQGGWSQRRYQNRADQRVEAFARSIAEETRRAFEESGQPPEYLIVAADEPISSALDAAWHQSVKERIIGRVSLEMEANLDAITAAAWPLVEEREQQEEIDAVQAVKDGAASGGRGVAGPEETILALENGQVMTLVMNDDFSRPGWADNTLPVYGVGEVPRAHPAGGDVANLIPTALEDELVRLALQTGASVELVRTAVPILPTELENIPDADAAPPRAPAALALDALGGVGAILRFVVEEGASGTRATI